MFWIFVAYSFNMQFSVTLFDYSKFSKQWVLINTPVGGFYKILKKGSRAWEKDIVLHEFPQIAAFQFSENVFAVGFYGFISNIQ